MSAPLERLLVVGLGLLGGSVALAARRRGVARHVVGATRREEVRRRALRDGAVDEVLPLDGAARGADLVVLATPVHAMADVLAELAPGLGDGAIVTDVGSVKAPLAETLPGLLPPGAVYIGSHPMAGGHAGGFEHARADLFEGAACIVTTPGDPAAVARVSAFWSGLGARVVSRDVETHDAEVAWMSHVPHVLAFAFARALARAPQGAGEVAGAGFRDFTRIAQSDAELWGDILTANRKSLAAPLQGAAAALAELARSIESGDAEALEQQLASARQVLFRASQAGSRPTQPETKTSSPRGERPRGESQPTHD